MARRNNPTPPDSGIGVIDGAGGDVDGNGGIENAIGGDDSGGLRTVNPADIGGNPGSDAADSHGGGSGNDGKQYAGAKRGRKPGQKNGTGKAAQGNSTVSISGLEKSLIGIHTALAALTKSPEFNIDKDEARAIAEASANVARHYNATINPKMADWFALIGCLGAIYGPRFVAMVRNRKGGKRNAAPPAMTAEQNTQAGELAFNLNLPTIGGVPTQH